MTEELDFSSESGFVQGDFSSGTNEPLLLPLNSNGATCDIFRKILDGKTTVVKRLSSQHLHNAIYHELFRKEYETGCQLDCPHIVHYLDYYDEDDNCYIEMEFVDGETLKERLQNNPGYFANRQNLDKFLLQLLDGLHYMHSRQIVHLDLKPDNIMLSKVNNDVKILDLGYCYSDAFQTTIGCNHAFASPEQLDGSADVDARTDIYAVGKLLEHILSVAKLSHIRKYNKVINRCISEDKKKRYQNVLEINKDIKHDYVKLYVTLGIVAVVAIAVVLCSFVNIHRLLFGYDFADDTLCYNILSEEDKTCELVKYDPSLETTGAKNISIKPEVDYNGEVYKVKAVASRVFEDNSIITTLSILSSDIHFSREVFRRCSELKFVYVNDDFNSFSQGLFGCCHKLEAFRFPSVVTEIPQACFHQTGLKTLSLPDGVKVIRQDAFCDCDSLTEIKLPKSLVTLERGVFFQCDNLESVTIPANTKNIGQYCFMDCPKLKTIYNYATEPQRVLDIFDEGVEITVFVPSQSLDLYRTADCWRNCNLQPLP